MRKDLTISVPSEPMDPNDHNWDMESFNLIEHLFELIKIYGYNQLMDELKECKRIDYKKNPWRYWC